MISRCTLSYLQLYKARDSDSESKMNGRRCFVNFNGKVEMFHPREKMARKNRETVLSVKPFSEGRSVIAVLIRALSFKNSLSLLTAFPLLCPVLFLSRRLSAAIEKSCRGLSPAIMLHGQLKCAVGY